MVKICKGCDNKAYRNKNFCNPCMYQKTKINRAIYHKNWYKNNKKRILKKQSNKYHNDSDHKQKILTIQKEYRKINSEYLKVYHKEYRKKNRKKITKWFKDKYHKDINHKLKATLRNSINRGIKKDWIKGSAVRDLGCSIDKLKIHLEKQFQPGMTWKNWSLKGWHIDHIIPLYHFELTNRKEFLKAAHYTNLKPMWAIDNLRKNKYLEKGSGNVY